MLSQKIIDKALDRGCSYAKLVTMDNYNLTINYELGIPKYNESKIKTHSLYVIYLGKHGKVTFTCNDDFDIEKLIQIAQNTAKLNTLQYSRLNNCNLKKTKFNLEETNQIKSTNIKSWFEYEVKRIEHNMNINLMFASYSLRTIYMSIYDSNKTHDTQFIKQDAVTLMSNMSSWFHKRDIGFNADIYSIFKDNKIQPIITPNTTSYSKDLKGSIVIKNSCMHYILSNIIMIFNSRNIINKRSFIDSSMFRTKIFKDTINIIDDPYDIEGVFNYRFDHEGTYTLRKHIVSSGILNDFLNTVKTSSILGGTPGNCFTEVDIPQLDINSTNIILEINENIERVYDILIEDIDVNKSSIDIGCGTMNLYLKGFYRDNVDIKIEFKLTIDICDFMNKIIPASESYWNNNIKSPDIYIKI